MNFDIIDFYNPWWKSQNLTEINEHLLSEYNRSKLQRNYSGCFNTRGNGLYVLKGPRQVGKSTLMRYTIYELLKNNPGRCIIYIPADTIKNFKELRDILFHYLRISEHCKKRFVFIDEITYIKEWQRAIKEMRDNTKYKNDFFLVTGSSAWSLKRSTERMPGRRGDESHPDKLLLPVNFREFLRITRGIEPPGIQLEDILKLKKKQEVELQLLSTDIKPHLDTYIKTGGFLSVVERIMNDTGIKPIVNVFWDIIIGDIERTGLDRSIFIRLIRHFGKITGNRFSFNNISQEMEIDVKTVQRYIYALSNNFLGTLLPFLDKNKLHVKEKKMKKFYFIDPFLYEVLHQKTGIQLEKPILVESVILRELLHFATGIEEGLSRLFDFGYWYSDKGKEVDFIASGIPIESKFKTRVKESEKNSILKHFKEGIILSKDDIDFSGEVKVIPIHLFLALLSSVPMEREPSMGTGNAGSLQANP